VSLPKWPVRFAVRGMNLQQCTESWLEYERARADAWEARCRMLYAAVKGHNDALLKACGEGDQAGVPCGYRPYFPRRCPNCPLDDQIYDEEGRQLLDVAIGELPP
jgi:hypothetical protein